MHVNAEDTINESSTCDLISDTSEHHQDILKNVSTSSSSGDSDSGSQPSIDSTTEYTSNKLADINLCTSLKTIPLTAPNTANRGKIGQVCSFLMARQAQTTADVTKTISSKQPNASGGEADELPKEPADCNDRDLSIDTASITADNVIKCDTSDDNEFVFTVHHTNTDDTNIKDEDNNNEKKVDCDDHDGDEESIDKYCEQSVINDDSNAVTIQKVNLRRNLNHTSIIKSVDGKDRPLLVRSTVKCEPGENHQCAATVVATSTAVDQFKPVSNVIKYLVI